MQLFACELLVCLNVHCGLAARLDFRRRWYSKVVFSVFIQLILIYNGLFSPVLLNFFELLRQNVSDTLAIAGTLHGSTGKEQPIKMDT